MILTVTMAKVVTDQIVVVHYHWFQDVSDSDRNLEIHFCACIRLRAGVRSGSTAKTLYFSSGKPKNTLLSVFSFY